MPYTTYIVRTENDRLYVGHTGNLQRRLVEHALGSEGSKFLKEPGVPFGVVYVEGFPTRVEAFEDLIGPNPRQTNLWAAG